MWRCANPMSCRGDVMLAREILPPVGPEWIFFKSSPKQSTSSLQTTVLREPVTTLLLLLLLLLLLYLPFRVRSVRSEWVVVVVVVVDDHDNTLSDIATIIQYQYYHTTVISQSIRYIHRITYLLTYLLTSSWAAAIKTLLHRAISFWPQRTW